eukprot:3154659-Amphidinium_carterae.1
MEPVGEDDTRGDLAGVEVGYHPAVAAFELSVRVTVATLSFQACCCWGHSMELHSPFLTS